jgi:hypothetical protein
MHAHSRIAFGVSVTLITLIVCFLGIRAEYAQAVHSPRSYAVSANDVPESE